MRKQRGALAMVLCVSLLLFTIALGFATMVSLQLNLSTSSLASHQAEMAARAASAEVQYEIDQKLRQYWAQPVPLSGATPINLNLQQRFQDPTAVFPAPTPDTPATCRITFDTSQPCYSTDNLDGPLPANGWLMANGQPDGLVPANSVDLLVQTMVGGTRRVYEAVLTQQWPYGACSISGPLQLSNCNVIGNLYGATAPTSSPAIQLGGDPNAKDSSDTSVCTVQGDLCTWLPPGTPDPFQILNGAAVEGRNCYNVALGGSVPGGADDNPPPNLIAVRT
ncbi:MAG: hypothetical protein ACYCW6_12650, partial [Candidatus Xenobia bacterium]